MSAAETLHLTAVQQLTHRGDIPKGSWPEKLERVTVLSPDNSKAVTDIQAVVENKGKRTIQLPRFTRTGRAFGQLVTVLAGHWLLQPRYE
ncbi:hypothetical protein [Rhodococcus qingshengii]|uniref:hypothetical protein n=1 Tax=Rhodococcus qingshengii TaxID=334542 RepID=UPI00116125E0|nr:hypothetical protein [Rhodococcus qingshengii]MCZ4547974.1 hypothetical protein [Rhodococcus qingshengii]UGQ55489.1 hypothetical protein LRL17_31595 [Rhodococcus qingshengii]